MVTFSILIYAEINITSNYIYEFESNFMSYSQFLLTDEDKCPKNSNTAPVTTSDIFRALFVTLQLYMIFKYSNVIVNRSKRLAKLAFMHCIVSSLCFWLSGIINETRQSLVIHAMDYHHGEHKSFDGKCIVLKMKLV